MDTSDQLPDLDLVSLGAENQTTGLMETEFVELDGRFPRRALEHVQVK